jgi:hypothetical protein
MLTPSTRCNLELHVHTICNVNLSLVRDPTIHAVQQQNKIARGVLLRFLKSNVNHTLKLTYTRKIHGTLGGYV